MKCKFHHKIICGTKLNSMNNSSFKYIEINPSSISDIQTLYERLASRKYSISHRFMPSFKHHQEFVSSHPYRHWCFIYKENVIGTYYVTDMNSIGIDLDEEFYESIQLIALEINRRHHPLPPISSVRAADFHINVSSKNTQLCKVLEQKGFAEIQRTFRLSQDNANFDLFKGTLPK